MRKTQSAMINVKTVIPVDDLRREVMRRWPACIFVAATHTDAKTPHVHAVIRFELPTRWDKFDQWLDTHDKCYYAQPARSWIRSVRYLLHLDNAEKPRVPRTALVYDGIDEDELEQLLGSQKMKILDSLVEAQKLPLYQRFRYLVEVRGHLPSEVSAALRCLIDLEKWAETNHGTYSALPTESELLSPDDTVEVTSVFDDEVGGDAGDEGNGGSFYD